MANPKSAVHVPTDVLASLRRGGALRAWAAMPPSHKRAYLDAIEEARKPETRRRRIAGAVKMIKEYRRA